MGFLRDNIKIAAQLPDLKESAECPNIIIRNVSNRLKKKFSIYPRMKSTIQSGFITLTKLGELNLAGNGVIPDIYVFPFLAGNDLNPKEALFNYSYKPKPDVFTSKRENG